MTPELHISAYFGYIAGIIDGEGTIRIHKSKTKAGLSYTPNIYVKMADVEPLQLLQILYGGSIKMREPEKDGWLIQYYWQAGNQERVKKLLNDIGPYLLVKRRQADVCIEFMSEFPRYKSRGRDEEKEKYYKLCRILNRSIGDGDIRESVIEVLDRRSA